MDDGMDYDVQTTIHFRLDFDGSGEFNMLLLPDVQKQFVQHVKEVYEKDNTLGSGYVSSDLNFRFDGRMVHLEYTFHCHDENEAEAESFSTYSVQCVQEALEEFGCKIRKIECKAEEADMTWLDRLEDAIFGTKDKAQNSDTILYLGGNESSTHKYISEALGKATIDTRTHGQTKGKSGSYSTNFQMSGRELLTPDEVRGLDNRYAILFIRGAKPVMDLKYELTDHPAIRYTVDGGGPPYIHHQEKPELKFQGEPLFTPETDTSDEEKETATYEDHEEVPEAPEHPGVPEED